MRSLRRSAALFVAILFVAGCTDDTGWDRRPPAAATSSVGADAVGGAEDARGASRASRPADTTDGLTELVEAAAAAEDVPGVLVGVRWADGEEWVHAAGVGDLDTGEPLDPAAEWPARSITKSFTVTALLELVADGVVALDDTVDQYVDGVPGGDRVTLESLALMTSGLPDYTNERFAEEFVEDPTRVFSDEELLAFVDGEQLEAEPGSEHRYINTNTLVLGMALAAATGRSVDEVLSAVTSASGLGATRYRPEADTVDAPVGYQPDEGSLEQMPLTFGVFGAAGAMATDLDDLLDWGSALGSGAGLPPELADLRTAVAFPLEEGPEYDRYGLGIGELDGWWGHTGEGLGYTALVMNDPATDTTVAIFSNVSNLERGHLPTQLFRELAPVIAQAS